uniref:Uncharacterized protein n=1 Tax=Anguilla anguilla TaxID=7936 RepID=A0A0E9TCN3_ANGAN
MTTWVTLANNAGQLQLHYITGLFCTDILNFTLDSGAYKLH